MKFVIHLELWQLSQSCQNFLKENAG